MFFKRSLLFSFALQTLLCTGQNPLIEKANLQYQLLEFSAAITTYESALSKEDANEITLKNIANCYYNLSRFEQAVVYFERLFERNKNQDSDSFVKFASCLKSVGKYDDANLVMSNFSKQYPRDLRAKAFVNNPNYLNKIKQLAYHCIIKNIDLNTENIEYGGFINNNKFYFTAYQLGQKNIDKWTNQSYARIFVAPIDAQFNFGKPELLFPINNRAENESSAVLTKDGKTIYFTRNDQKKVSKINAEKSYYLKIYKATLINGSWQNIEALPFCSDNFNTANATLSLDEKTMYFASDRYGTKGNSDIYSVAIDSNGNFGTPKNLSDINTASKENFPFIANNGKLYFSSDGHLGIGGMDLYAYDFETHDIDNLGPEINSQHDDFALYLINHTGFLSSNRVGGKGCDDIYKITEFNFDTPQHENHSISEKISPIGGDLAKIIDLKPIYFDLDKWDIRADAKVEIDKIAALMYKFPEMIIAINSHTDSRNTATYNLKLSQKRATATRTYLIRQGINSERMIAKGFGESQLVNTCIDDEQCTENEHQQNRRTEFMVLKF